MNAKMMAVLLASTAVLSLGAATEVEVGNVPDLIAQLRALNGTAGNVIKLKAGDYHLPDEAMVTNDTQYGNGLSTLDVNRIKLIGLGAKPEDVKLIGAGNLRVINTTGSAAWIENLMITNGNATVKYNGRSYSVNGGGVYGGGTVTNCIITGCRADFGGGVAIDTVVRDCRVVGNYSMSGGGGINNCYAYGCLIADNVSDSDGGGAYSPKVLVDCRLIGNRAASAKTGGGLYIAKAVTNCTFAGNSAGYGGGIGNYTGNSPSDHHLWNCTITNNTTTGTSRGGAGAYRHTLHGCLVANNVAQANAGGGTFQCSLFDSVVSNNVAEASSGGGIYLKDEAGLVVSNCLVYANRCFSGAAAASGGGVYGDGETVIDSVVTGNCALKGESSAKTSVGGGAVSVRLVGCRVHDNYADNYGGGLYSGTAVDCRIYNNVSAESSGLNTYVSELLNCDIADAPIYGGSAESCVFHGICGSVTLTNNPYKVGFEKISSHGVTDGYPNATNCLFVGNLCDQQLFTGNSGATAPSALVNCTIVSNTFRYTFAYFNSEGFPLRVVNCVFFGNRTPGDAGVARDVYPNVNSTTTAGIRFANVIYGVAKDDMNFDDWTDPEDRGTIWQFGANGIAATPKFSGSADAPFEPKTSSPLVGRGKVMDWMASAHDIRGMAEDGKYLRLRNGKCDLGCYQCWLDAPGLLLLFR